MNNLKLEDHVLPMLADLRERCLVRMAAALRICSCPTSTQEHVAREVGAVPLIIGNTPPGIAYGPTPTNEEVRMHAEAHPCMPSVDRGFWLVRPAGGFPRVITIHERDMELRVYKSLDSEWLPLGSNGLPCTRPLLHDTDFEKDKS